MHESCSSVSFYGIQATRDAVAATQETVEEIGEWIRVKPDEEKRPWWARLWGK